MLYFVKTYGPVVLTRGPFKTEAEATATRYELERDPIYKGQTIFVEESAFDVSAERALRPIKRRALKQKPRDRRRSDGRGGSAVKSSTKRRRKRNASRRK